uniref:KIF-binding protein n=1 Tax=Megaselia scalaris TaxID=36166 RepID=T1GMA8_MEGSC
MSSQKEIFSDIKEKFERAYHLVDDESKSDPPSDPFRSHYAARTILEDLVQSLRETIENDDNFLYKVFLGFACRDLGRIYVFTEEPFTGEKYLKECLQLVDPYKLKKEAIIAYIGASNEMGIVECNRGNHKEALEHLKRSEDIYEQFQYLADSPMSITDLFGPADEVEKGKGPKEIAKIYTLCTYYMAQYCNLTLKRQLESDDYDPIDWALNAATLSQYYIGPNLFKEARHHLAAATLIMTEFEGKMVTDEMTLEAKEAIKESFNHRFADIARCWAKYGLALLNASRERLMADDDVEKVTK